jgi:hypothetical protein
MSLGAACYFRRMIGITAYLVLIGFLVVAAFLFSAIFVDWKNRPRTERPPLKLIGTTAFLVLWFALISSLYVRKARFHYDLRQLSPSDVYSIQIGRHDFRDPKAIEDLVGALRQSRWFEANHGGWGDSIPMRIRRHSGNDFQIDAAKYFPKPAAIIGPSDPRGLGYSATEAFAPELSSLLEKYGVQLPDCDTPHGKPCTDSQLNP